MSKRQSQKLLTLHIGQAGCQMGHALWELYCLEHGIKVDGNSISSSCYGGESTDASSHFQETGAGKLTPRAVFIDLEPTVIDEIRTGAYRKLFHPDSLKNGCEDAASNYARGRYTMGMEVKPALAEALRHQFEQVERMSGVLMLRGLPGGTGSGFGALAVNHLQVENPKCRVISLNNFPSPHVSNVVTQPYNSILAAHASNQSNGACNIMFDNEAAWNMMDKQLQLKRATYTNLNRVLAQALACLTAPLRFPTGGSSSMEDILTNMVPFPRLQSPMVAYAPCMAPEKAMHSTMTATTVALMAFDPNSHLLSMRANYGKYLSAAFFFRGNVSPQEATLVKAKLDERKNIPGQEPPDMVLNKVNSLPPITVPGGDLAATPFNCCMLAHHTGIGTVWGRLVEGFQQLYKKRAFVHWYVGEGMEEGEFQVAQDDLAGLEQDYKTMAEGLNDDEGGPGGSNDDIST